MNAEADDEPRTFNEELRDEAANPTSRREEVRQMLFPPPPPTDPPTKPEGDGDGGKGTAPDHPTEDVWDGTGRVHRMRVFPLDNNPNNDNHQED